MSRFALILLVAATLSACDRPSVESTPEEAFMTQMYTMMNAGLAYDESCNGSKYIAARNANLFGNLSMVATRLYQATYNSRIEKSKADIERQIKFQGQYALARAKEVFDNKGCGSAEARNFAKALALYTSTPPDGVAGMMDAQMLKGGIARAPKRR